MGVFDSIKNASRTVYDSLPQVIKSVLSTSKSILDNPVSKIASIGLSHLFPAIGVPLTAYEIASSLTD